MVFTKLVFSPDKMARWTCIGDRRQEHRREHITDTQMKTKSENSYFVAVRDLLPDESSLSWKTDLTL